MNASQCVFCRILASEAAGSFVYRDELVSAILDIQPINEGHLLVVPNDHVVYLADLDSDVGERMFLVAKRMAAVLRASEIPCEGVNLFLADGEVAMQEIFHVHLHVIPRVRNDGFGFTFGSNYADLPSRSLLNATAETLRGLLAS